MGQLTPHAVMQLLLLMQIQDRHLPYHAGRCQAIQVSLHDLDSHLQILMQHVLPDYVQSHLLYRVFKRQKIIKSHSPSPARKIWGDGRIFRDYASQVCNALGWVSSLPTCGSVRL